MTKSCKACTRSEGGRIGRSCPLNGRVDPSYSGGCDYPDQRQAEIALPSVPFIDAKDSQLEKRLQRLCELELNRRGIQFLHLSPNAREKKGWPDLIFAIAGRPCAVELKSPVGRLSDDQKAILDGLERDGWEVAVLRTYAQFRAFLECEQTEDNAV